MRLDNGAAPRDNWYRLGYCPQCQAQVMVRNTSGIFDSYRANCLFAHLLFCIDEEEQEAVKTIICDQCFQAPNYQVLVDAITHLKSEAFAHKNPKWNELGRNYIKSRVELYGYPTKIRDVSPGFLKKTMFTAQLKSQGLSGEDRAAMIFQG